MKPSSEKIKSSIKNLKKTIYSSYIYDNGDEEYFYKGRYHRLDGPAHITNNIKYWYINGEHIVCSSLEEFQNSKEYRTWKIKAFK